jgi:N utilization substance protein A
MDNTNLIESFSELKEMKNIDRTTMSKVMQDVFKTVIVKKYGSADNFDIIVNPTKGDLEIWRNRIVVDENFEDFDDNEHILLSEVIKTDPDFEVGEEFSEEVKIIDFGRRSISTIRQILKSKIMDIGKEDIYKKYKEREGEIIVGEVYQILRKEVIILDDEGNELLLPKSEQISSDFFRKGDSVRAVVSAVEIRNNNLCVILSRTSNKFLEKLFELEIPEVFDGLVTVKGIAREPGVKSKVAVESYDDRIDPVGTCVGSKGSRINGVVRELKSENIDIINYTTNTQLYIIRALNQSKATSVELDEVKKTANIFLHADQISLAIGRGGLNIKLASKLTGYKINVFSDSGDDEDVFLEDFSDEIDGWIIDEFKKIGCDTAKSVLDKSFNDLVKRTDLEEETIRNVISILKSEFN